MGFGKLLCVIVHLALTFASVVCIITVCLAGITTDTLQLFEISTANFTTSPSSLNNLARDILPRDLSVSPENFILSKLNAAATESSNGLISDISSIIGDSGSSGNITAKTLGLADKYNIFLWNYCRITGTNSDCTNTKLGWATENLNTSSLELTASTSSGTPIKLPDEMKVGLDSFVTVSRWTQLFYLAALGSGLFGFILGIVTIFLKAGSFMTLVITVVATATILIASILATVQALVSTAALNSAAKAYKVGAKINPQFLAISWIAVAFSAGASVLWAMTSCCCAAGHSSGRGRSTSIQGDEEKSASDLSYRRLNY